MGGVHNHCMRYKDPFRPLAQDNGNNRKNVQKKRGSTTARDGGWIMTVAGSGWMARACLNRSKIPQERVQGKSVQRYCTRLTARTHEITPSNRMSACSPANRGDHHVATGVLPRAGRVWSNCQPVDILKECSINNIGLAPDELYKIYRDAHLVEKQQRHTLPPRVHL